MPLWAPTWMCASLSLALWNLLHSDSIIMAWGLMRSLSAQTVWKLNNVCNRDGSTLKHNSYIFTSRLNPVKLHQGPREHGHYLKENLPFTFPQRTGNSHNSSPRLSGIAFCCLLTHFKSCHKTSVGSLILLTIWMFLKIGHSREHWPEKSMT